jgi:hypothetical protein
MRQMGICASIPQLSRGYSAIYFTDNPLDPLRDAGKPPRLSGVSVGR